MEGNNMKFSQDIVNKLGYYIYLYIDPIDNKIFYIGKGKGNRVFDHLTDESDTKKTLKIKEILNSGKEPKIEILIHGIKDEETALRIECAVIDIFGVENLSN